MKNILRIFSSTTFIAFLFFTQAGIVVKASEVTAGAEVQASGEGLVSRIAPGEFLPISIKLLNFGSSERVDVDILYQVFDVAQNEIFAAHDTVAVQTTASFIKTIKIAPSTPPGEYSVMSSITYDGQKVPATTKFSFLVERKILGLFEDEFYLYGGITFILCFIAGIIGHILIKKHRSTRIIIFDYSDIPKDERIFYEIVSDTIGQLRQHIGDRALDIASNINDLKIDLNTGRVIDIKKSPSKIISSLISECEKL